MRTLSKACSRFGAEMGRPNVPPSAPCALKLQKLAWVDGDYDEGGAYWGGPSARETEHIWWAYVEDGDAEVFVRAKDRADAKRQILLACPFDTTIEDDFDLAVEEMLASYILCALWSSADGEEGTPIDRDHGPEDVADETREAMRADCAKFLEENRADVGDNLSQAGHDFWLDRAGHGCGFRDGGRGWTDEQGERLYEAAKGFGSVDMYVGDDGKVYGG